VIAVPQLVENRRRVARATGERYRIRKAPRMQHPVAFESEYGRYIRSIVEFTAARIRDLLFPRIPFLQRSASVTRGDAYTDDLNEIFRTIRATVGAQFTDEQIRRAIRDRGLKIADWNRRQMTAVLASALSVDVYFSEPWLAGELNGFVHTNVELIKSIPQDQLRDAEIRVGSAIRSGARVGEIEDQIQGEFGVNAKASNRAELIARDQVGKFNGDLNRMRQKELGIEEYVWRTVRDERVRPYHAELEGTSHRWDDPPVVSRDGRREHPGGDYQCRCQAEPKLDF
jgi:SPP1 gp7 family putative phage head morphogenesis protein